MRHTQFHHQPYPALGGPEGRRELPASFVFDEVFRTIYKRESKLRNIPIVLSAFGTTTSAMKTYGHIDAQYRQQFPDNPIHWAFTSRVVKNHHRSQKRNLKTPIQVIGELAEKNVPWAVVQSLHITTGHEFYRLLENVQLPDVRSVMGLPLLHQPPDYMDLVQIMMQMLPAEKDTAAIFVGHGTDHPIWAAYTALHHLLQQSSEGRAHITVIEGGYPEMEDLLPQLRENAIKKARLIPLMLVAGIHFMEDLAGEEDSLRADLEEEGIDVELLNQGLGMVPTVIDIFARHTREALAICEGEDCDFT